MKVKSIKSQLLQIADKCFCAHTFDRGEHEWDKIKCRISENQRDSIQEYINQIGNPDYSPCGYGNSKNLTYQNRCVQLKKYIESLEI